MSNAAGDESITNEEQACNVGCKPFVKWVGGKTQLLPELLRRLPPTYKRYFEPFLGGGALLFSTQPKLAYVSDSNEDLINAYLVVKTKVEELIIDLSRHKYEKEYFYRIRNVDRRASFSAWTDVQKASRLIYLNKTCFNGLYRVNRKGFFNTPFGRYSNPTILNPTHLRACSEALQVVDISSLDFEAATNQAEKNDFVYFDPPYVPLTSTSYFTNYSKEGFSVAMQGKLYETCCALNNKGVKFMLSNSSSPFVSDLYKQFKIDFVLASRAVNSIASKRGKIDEIIVTNY